MSISSDTINEFTLDERVYGLWSKCLSRFESITMLLEKNKMEDVELIVLPFKRNIEQLALAIKRKQEKMTEGGQGLSEKVIRQADLVVALVVQTVEKGETDRREWEEFLCEADRLLALSGNYVEKYSMKQRKRFWTRVAAEVVFIAVLCGAVWFYFSVQAENQARASRERTVRNRIAKIKATSDVGIPEIAALARVAMELESYYLENGYYPECKVDEKPQIGELSVCKGGSPDWIADLPSSKSGSLPVNIFDPKQLSKARVYKYRTNRRDYKLQLFMLEDCSRAENPDLIDVLDPKRPCKALGFWTDNAVEW